jgi:hypothetical protein
MCPLPQPQKSVPRSKHQAAKHGTMEFTPAAKEHIRWQSLCRMNCLGSVRRRGHKNLHDSEW